jgi:antirestriction protein ArdC
VARKWKKTFERADVYETITNQIIAMLEKGVRPWSRSWNGEDQFGMQRPLKHGGQPYRGINTLVLWMTAMGHGYRSPYWMTYDRAIEYGGHVRKGETSTKIVFYKTVVKNEGTDEENRYGVPRAFPVFNVDQIDDLPEKFALKQEPVVAAVKSAHERLPEVDAFFDGLNLKLKHGGNKAFYSPSQDRIQMPKFDDFQDAESYYLTLAHETIHWTRHEKRLDRSFGRERWGDEGYATEELVAELGAAYLGADLGIAAEPREDHASYIDNWLKVLRNDKRAIFTAASHAEKAVDYLHTLVAPAVISADNDNVDEIETGDDTDDNHQRLAA